MRFQNGCNKVAIELRVVQFWSEIKLVISNQTRAARSFDFEITRMISDQIALHSVQLPLLIDCVDFARVRRARTSRWFLYGATRVLTLAFQTTTLMFVNFQFFDT